MNRLAQILAEEGLTSREASGMPTVTVKFRDPKLNYSTSVSKQTTEEKARDYFVGKRFDVGVYPEERMERVIDIEYTPAGGRLAFDWDSFEKKNDSIAAPTWRNYNTVGKRKNIKTVLRLLQSREPATLSILFKKDSPDEYAKVKSKWGSKGQTVKERGIAGKLVDYRGANLLIANVGGDEVIIRHPRFKL